MSGDVVALMATNQMPPLRRRQFLCVIGREDGGWIKKTLRGSWIEGWIGAPDNDKPELIYYIVDWWFLHPNYEFKPKELERSKYPRIEEIIY